MVEGFLQWAKPRILVGVVVSVLVALCCSASLVLRSQHAEGRETNTMLVERVSRESADGDGFLDKGWKEMWDSIPAGYAAVKKELSGGPSRLSASLRVCL